MSLFMRSRTNGNAPVSPGSSYEATDRPNTIVENARREFASAFGDLARGKRNWQIAACVTRQAYACPQAPANPEHSPKGSPKM
jgi:hypothetical protein